MTNIYSSKGSKVIKNEDNIYTLESSNSLFLSYLTNVMPNISKRNPSSIVFQSKSVMTLSQQLAHHKHGLSYEAVDGIMRQIIKQIKFFEQNQFGLLFVSPEDIINIVPLVLGHRVLLTYEANIDKMNSKNIVLDIAKELI